MGQSCRAESAWRARASVAGTEQGQRALARARRAPGSLADGSGRCNCRTPMSGAWRALSGHRGGVGPRLDPDSTGSTRGRPHQPTLGVSTLTSFALRAPDGRRRPSRPLAPPRPYRVLDVNIRGRTDDATPGARPKRRRTRLPCPVKPSGALATGCGKTALIYRRGAIHAPILARPTRFKDAHLVRSRRVS